MMTSKASFRFLRLAAFMTLPALSCAAFNVGVSNTTLFNNSSFVDSPASTRSFAFTTDDTFASFSLDSVSIRLIALASDAGGATMTLHSDGTNGPGALLGGLTPVNADPIIGDNFYTGSNLIIDPLTTYWISFNFAQASSSPFITYGTTTDSNSVGEWSFVPGTHIESGVGPFRYSGDYFIASIVGSEAPAIPEPSAFAAFTGLLVCAYAATRRRRP